MFTLDTLPLPPLDLLPPHTCFGVAGDPCGRTLEYAGLSTPFPPVVAVALPHAYRFVDGSHRIAAARLRGQSKILAAIFPTLHAAHRLMRVAQSVGAWSFFAAHGWEPDAWRA